MLSLVMSGIDTFKSNYLNSLPTINTFKACWNFWRPQIENKLNPMNGQSLFDLGDYLRDIFFSSNTDGRSQSGMSSGGTGWECLVTWYLNLVFWNTPIVTTRMNKKYVPKVLYDCIAVNIANNSSNTESDIIIFNVPDDNLFNGKSVEELNDFLKDKIDRINLWILQCKTNWNDNAQVPMLWDLVYSARTTRTNVSVGINGYSPSSLNDFRYAFATVPSQKNLSTYKSNSTCVLRVKNLSGGNYWGTKSKPEVASNIKELPTKVYRNFRGGVISHLQNFLIDDNNQINKFLNTSW